MSNEVGKMRVYGCGGAGVNLARVFTQRSPEAGYATVHPAFIDTSRSNLKDLSEGDGPTFLVSGLDGSGKVRAENSATISENIKKILLDIKPMDFNVVVFSASGGSGSVLAPLLLGELISRGHQAVAVVVGSDESIITCNNTLNTLKSLDAIARSKQQPIVMYYDHNSRSGKRSDTDESLTTAISSLSVLASRQNDELDSKDVSNWINFHKVSDISPQLASLEVFSDNEKVEGVVNPVTIASIYRDPDQTTVDVVPDYQCSGYSAKIKEGIQNLHFVVSVDEVPTIANGIQKTLDSLEEVRSSRVANKSLVSTTDSVDATGLVL